MKKTLLLIIAITLSLIASAQTQQGYVKTKGRMVDGKHVPGQGIKGATVTVLGSNSVLVNTDDGSFSFPVPSKNYQLKEVKKNGYQLVDADIIRRSYTYSTTPLYIVMETPEQQLQDQLESERKIRRNLQRKLQQREDELEAMKEAHKITLEEYQQAMQKLYADQENNERLISDMAKQYAQMDYDQMDDLNQRISDAILNGRLTEADSLLRSKGDIASRIEEVRREQQATTQREQELEQAQVELEISKTGSQKKLEDIAEDCYKYFNICKLNMDWDSAAYYITLRAELDTSRQRWQYDAACYYYNQNNFKQTEKYRLRNLWGYQQLAKENPYIYEPALAAALHDLALLYDETQRYTESEAFYLEALEIRRRLAKDDPQEHESGLAETLNGLANLYSITQRLSESESMYLEAIEIQRRLAKENPQIHEPNLAKMLHNLALLYYDTKYYSESESLFLEAIEIDRRLAKINPKAYEFDLAMTLSNFANLYFVTNRTSESEALYQESLELFSNLTKYNPKAYEPYLAWTMGCLAHMYLNTQRISNSESLFLEALVIYRRIAKDNPSAYESNLAETLLKVGWLYAQQEQYAEAIPFVEESLQIYRRLAQDNPMLNNKYLEALNLLVRLYSKTEDFSKYYENNEEWLPFLKTYYQTDAKAYQEDYVTTLGNQSYCAILKRNFPQAELYAREALSIDPNQHWIGIDLAAALLFQGKTDDAIYYYRLLKDEMKDELLQALKEFENAGAIPEERKADVERIRKMLNE